MSKGKPPRHGGQVEDRALWEIVARTVEPARGKLRVPDVETPRAQTAPAHGEETRQPLPSALVKRSLHSAPKPDRTGPTAAPSPARPAVVREPKPEVLTRRRARRIARGAEEIEARIDLHGMTQDAARQALTGFIRRCHARGLRTVLVITGKGGSAARGGIDEDGWHRPRGVIKRNVPGWLAEPDMAAIVVSYSQANVRHGGEGAIYVRLRASR